MSIDEVALVWNCDFLIGTDRIRQVLSDDHGEADWRSARSRDTADTMTLLSQQVN